MAGYQNRDKLMEMLNGQGAAVPQGNQPGLPQGGAMQAGLPGGGMGGGLGGLLGNLGGALGGAGAGGLLSGGLSDLVDRFRQSGQGDVAESWVNHGPNKDIAPHDLKTTIGADVLETLSQQTGLSQDELLARLSKTLPSAVDQYTPDGRLPA